MTLTGYLLIFGYILLLIFGLGNIVQKFTNGETSRKFIHIMLFMVWILIDHFLRGTIHQIIIPTVFIFLNVLSYRFQICKTIERTDGNHFGTIYFALAITAILTIAYFWPDFYLPSGIAVMCLTFGDGFAALIGYNFHSKKLYGNKSLYGFLAAFAATVISLSVFSFFYSTGLTPVHILLLGCVTAIFELVDWGLDNFSIVFSTFFLSYAFLHLTQERLVLSVTISVIVFVIIFFSHSIDYYGSLCSMAVVFCFSYFGGRFALAFLLASYFTVFFISAGKKFILHKKKSDHARTSRQILINGGIGTLLVVVYGLTGQTSLLIIGIVSVSGCFIDSLSSDLGVLSKKLPYDPFHRRRVPSGLSGGMSFLGTSAALAASAVIAYALGREFDLAAAQVLVIMMIIFAQTLVDTFFGSLLQVKYRCPKCNTLTEKPTHCDSETIYDSGIPWIDNNMVNLISSVIITVLACVISNF